MKKKISLVVFLALAGIYFAANALTEFTVLVFQETHRSHVSYSHAMALSSVTVVCLLISILLISVAWAGIWDIADNRHPQSVTKRWAWIPRTPPRAEKSASVTTDKEPRGENGLVRSYQVVLRSFEPYWFLFNTLVTPYSRSFPLHKCVFVLMSPKGRKRPLKRQVRKT